jgi:hypothetical protein
MILVSFTKKNVAVLIAVKSICENLSAVWVSDLVPNIRREIGALNARA